MISSLINPLTKNIKKQNIATNLKDYKKNGGYNGWAKTLDKSPSEIIKIVQDSNLRGRGGAGFNTGLKWSFVPKEVDEKKVKYLICNADEMEPGTFKDRLIMERDPHLLIEGMAIAAYAIGASKAYIFIRGEYHLAAERLEIALKEAHVNKIIGENIIGTEYSLNFHIHRSAGNYICGEETALINALEGKRAIPRAKPPFPQVSGLWGRPTVINNVETLCNLPHIIELGIDWYKGLGRVSDTGSKLFGVSGKVKKPGTWELPMGTPVREIIEQHAGGMCDGLKLRAFLPGGASTDFLAEDKLDLAMDFDVIGKSGSRMGTGTIIVLDNRTCPVGLVLNLQQFFARESCGWCTPCRDGLPWIVEILTRIENGNGIKEDLEILKEQIISLAPGKTFCALAPGAAAPLQSALKLFEDDFFYHIDKKHCPYKTKYIMNK